ncbi:MAG: tautomerase family protein [Deltaproteobacteria bacterium]|nr:tautomerase family protein [Deltaproteobacteria bacterium]NNL41918.1 tautomerase family protein [Desulfobacterales bacterium]
MPLVKVSLLKGKSKETKKAILTAIHSALVDAFKIPQNDKNQRIFEFDQENFAIPEGKTSNYTLIEIDLFPGRSLDAKKKFYKTIVQNFKKIGIQPDDIFIILKEPPLDNWGLRGGIPASEIDLGFKLDV